MRGTRAKQLRKMAVRIANKESGLLHEGKIELFKRASLEKVEKPQWMIRINLRQYAKDSFRFIFRVLKKEYTGGKLSLGTVRRFVRR